MSCKLNTFLLKDTMRTSRHNSRLLTPAVVGLLIIGLLLVLKPIAPSPVLAQRVLQPTIWLPLITVPARPFSPAVDGFSFANTVRTQQGELTSVELRRMFGDNVCGSPVASDGSCALTSPATRWMEWANSTMNNGYCEGMAIVSSLMYNGELRPQDFGAERIGDLMLEGNTKLQREIAYWSASLLLKRDTVVRSSPNDVLAAMRASIGKLGSPFGTLRFSMPDRSGGHAVLPFALRNTSATTVAVSVYDSNYPRQTREILIDTTDNTWFYSPDPTISADDYRGNAQSPTLGFAPIAPRLGMQDCLFCGSIANTPSLASSGSIVDPYVLGSDRQSIGLNNGNVNPYGGAPVDTSMFPSAERAETLMQTVPSWQNPARRYYTFGVSRTLTFDVLHNPQPTSMTMGAVVYIGPGFAFEVGNLGSATAQTDKLEISAGGTEITYTTEQGEVPELFLGFEAVTADFGFWLDSFEMEAGDQVALSIDVADRLVAVQINTSSPTDDVIFNLAMQRLTIDGEEDVFESPDDGLVLANGQTLLIDYSSWEDNGAALRVGYDSNANGALDPAEAFTVEDVGNSFDDK